MNKERNKERTKDRNKQTNKPTNKSLFLPKQASETKSHRHRTNMRTHQDGEISLRSFFFFFFFFILFFFFSSQNFASNKRTFVCDFCLSERSVCVSVCVLCVSGVSVCCAFAKYFKFAKDAVRIAFLQFSTDARFRDEVLDPNTKLLDVLSADPTTFAKAVDMKYDDEGTAIYKGVKLANELLALPYNSAKGTGGARADAQQVIFVITDGTDVYADDLREQIKISKQNGARIISIGVGKEVDTALLQEIASPCADPNKCENFFAAQDYSELLNTVVLTIVEAECEYVSQLSATACSTRSTTVDVKGAGFGDIYNPDLVVQLGDGPVNPIRWKSDKEAEFTVQSYEQERVNNKFGAAYQDWDGQTPGVYTIPMRISKDGGLTFLRDRSDSGSATLTYKVCEKVTNVDPQESCFEGFTEVTVSGQNFGVGVNFKTVNEDMRCAFGPVQVKAEWAGSGTAKCIVPPFNCSAYGECGKVKNGVQGCLRWRNRAAEISRQQVSLFSRRWG